MTLLTADDVDSIGWVLDCALFTATRDGHTGDIYDMVRVARSTSSGCAPDPPQRVPRGNKTVVNVRSV